MARRSWIYGLFFALLAVAAPVLIRARIATVPNIIHAAKSALSSGKDSPPHQVPMGNLEANPANIVPGSYLVHLFPGQALEDHFKRLGRDISQHVKFDSKIEDSVWYSTRDVNEEILRLIRSDPGVELVEHNVYAYLDQGDE